GGPDQAARQQSLQLRREHEQVVGARVVERLDAEPVTREDCAAPARIPHGDRELAAQLLWIGGPDTLVQVWEDLRVAAAAKDVAVGPQVASNVRVVIELAVLHGPDV